MVGALKADVLEAGHFRRIVATSLLELALSLGCSSEPTPHSDSADGGNSGQEFLDDAGICRRRLEPGIFGCEDSYDSALAAPSRCGAACAGPVGDRFVRFDDCTPSIGCAYDARTRSLVGALFGDDEANHCGGQNSVVVGEFPAVPEFNGFALDEACARLPQRNLSPVLDSALRREPLPELGMPCRSGHDDCRGPVTALVCADPHGHILADGICAHCVSGADCRSEYHYAEAVVTCGPGGHCVFGNELAGVCNGYGEGCFTAAAAFVCANGLCEACTANEQCSASGPYNLCLASTCKRSEPGP